MMGGGSLWAHFQLLPHAGGYPEKLSLAASLSKLSPSPVAKQWERVPEGRVRALCRSRGKTVNLSHGDHRSQAPRSSPPAAREPDTCRSTALVGTPQAEASELQGRSSMPDRPIHCRFSLPRRIRKIMRLPTISVAQPIWKRTASGLFVS